jgi:ubiquinone biosynthesis protein COQ4
MGFKYIDELATDDNSVTVGQIGYPAFILIDMLGSLLDYLVDTKTEVVDDRLEYNFDIDKLLLGKMTHARQYISSN